MVIRWIIWDFAWKTKSLNFQSLTRENIYDEKMKRMKGCSLNYWHWFSSKLKVVDSPCCNIINRYTITFHKSKLGTFRSFFLKKTLQALRHPNFPPLNHAPEQKPFESCPLEGVAFSVSKSCKKLSFLDQ